METDELTTEVPVSFIGRFLALEQMTLLMMSMFLDVQQRERVRSVLKVMEGKPGWLATFPPEMAEQLQAGRAQLHSSMHAALGASVVPPGKDET